MKKTGFFTLFFIFLCANVWGVDYTWNDGGDNDWTNKANWYDGVSPSAYYPGENNTNDTVTIDGNFSVTLTDNVPFPLDSLKIDGANFDLSTFSLTVDTLNFLSGNLYIDNNTLTVTGTLTQSAGTIELSDGTIEAGDITQTGGTINITNEGTLKSYGTVTQTGGIITGDKLILMGGGDFSLNNTGNAVENIQAVDDSVSHPNTVQFKNSVDLEMSGITAGGDVTITTNGNFTVSGNIETAGAITITVTGVGNDITLSPLIVIETSNGDITLESVGDIDIQGEITGVRLTAIAGGDVKIGTDGNITVTSNGDHTTPPGGTGAAIYISANDFKPENATLITPGASGVMYLELIVAYLNNSFDGYVLGDAYYIHNVITTLKNLVYYNSLHPSFPSLLVLESLFPSSDYEHIDSSDSSNVYIVNYNKEIIIYFIGSNKDVTFTVGGVTQTGSITIYGDYSASSLTLNPGSGGIKFVDAEIEITVGSFNMAGVPLTLAGTTGNSITVTAASINLNAVSGGGVLFTLNGNVIFNGEVNIAAELAANGTAAINADITTTYNQTYDKAVTLGADVTLKGGTIHFKDTVDSDSTERDLTIMATNIKFDGEVGGINQIAVIDVTGISTIGTDITTVGNQIYNGTVTLAGTGVRELTSGGGSITTTGIVNAANGITVNAHGNITIGSGGINTGIIDEIIRLESGAAINIIGSITVFQLIGIAVGNVTVDNGSIITVHSDGDHDSPPGDGKGAAIYIKANDFITVNTTPITLVTSGGVMCLELNVPYSQEHFDAFIDGVYHVHNLTSVATIKHLVYYNSAISDIEDIKLEFSPTDYYYVEISDSLTEYIVNGDKNIIIYKIGNNDKVVTFTVSAPDPTGSITIYGEYSADNLILKPGISGVFLKDAKVEIKADNFNMTAVLLTLDGTTESSIKALKIILSNVIASDKDLTLEASDSISIDKITGGNNLTLKASDSISIDEIANGKDLTFEASGAISIGRINADVVSFGGGLEMAPLEIIVSEELCNAIIKQGSYVKVKNGGGIVQADGKTLELKNDAVLDISSGSWRIGGGTSVPGSFTGYYGALKLGEASYLLTNNFILNGASPNTFVVYNSGWATVSVLGDKVDIGNSVDLRPFGSNYAQFIIKMGGNGVQTLTTAQILGSLHVCSDSYTQLKNHLGLSGRMLINAQGVLDAGSYNVTLYAEISGGQKDGYQNPVIGRWEVEGVTETISANAPVYNYPMSGAFRQEPGGSVEFKKGALDGDVFFEIIGNTVWQKFICREAGAIIQFSMHPDQHVFRDTFEVKGASDNHITLTRYIAPNDAAKANWSIKYDNTKVPNGATDGAIVDSGLPSVPVMKNLKNEPPPYVELSKFWNFNVIPTGVQGYSPMDVDNLTVYFSHAWNQKVPISSVGIDVIPFYKGDGANRKGYFNYDWGSEGRAIIYSFAEDGNGNGKIDRLRVQTNVRLNADFRNFNVEVENYKVDITRGQSAVPVGVLTSNGFDIVSRITGDEEDDSSFYIYIEETDALYDGKPIIWRVTLNSSLKDISQILFVGTQDSDEVYKTTNTIPPRISYAFTLPGHPQTFVQMSQPVSTYGAPLTINGNRRSGTQDYAVIDRTPSRQFALEYNAPDKPPKQYNVNIPEGSLSYLLELDSPPTAASLAPLPSIGIGVPGEYFTLESLKDLTVRALDWSDPKVDDDSYVLYPPPRYPVDWNYSCYADYPGNSHIPGLSGDDTTNVMPVFLPPFDVLTPEMMRRLETYAAETAAGTGLSVLHVTPGDFVNPNPDNIKRRSTDVLVSIAPQDSSSLNYFAWPVWAKYDVISSGVVWDFDGTKYLENSDKNDIAVQVRLLNSNDFNLLGCNGLSLFYGFEVPVDWRNPAAAAERGKSTGGLWLPRDMSNNKNPLFNIVPDKTVDITTGRIGFYDNAKESSVTAAGQLFTFGIKADDFSNGGKIEFVLRLEGNSGDSNMFIARLDAPLGIIPSDWYAHIRPFSFDIINTRQQRGGVTILNNVINSDKKEVTYIRYNLPRSGRVTVQIYTLDGTLIKSLRRNEQREAGTYVDTWDGSNNGGRAVARGMYFVRVVGPDIDEIRKIMVVK